jgi:ribokinase
MAGKIFVMGSSNTDMVVKAEKFPLPGETIMGGTFFMNPGGKGANQAVAAARLGGEVTFLAKIGKDIFGNQALQQFQQEGIDTQYMVTDPEKPSGVALITVDAKGENNIVVAPGANAALMPSDLEPARRALQQSEILLMQLEIPLDTVAAAARIAADLGIKVILNPAPARSLPAEILQGLYLITPNESEAETLTGIAISNLATAEIAAEKLRQKGVANVVITLGAQGALVFTAETVQHVPAPAVTPIDTTAAGDVFNGALAVALAEGQNLVQAVTFANQAAAFSVTKLGAQASAPTREDLQGIAFPV